MDQAIERISAAIARIELASGRAREAAQAAQSRHDHLRGEVTVALRQIDALIASPAAPLPEPPPPPTAGVEP